MTVTQVTSRCGADGVVQRVTVTDFGMMGTAVDTTLSVASTLAPILARLRKFGRYTAIDFSPGLVRGTSTRQGVTREIRDTLATPAFNVADLTFVVRSLALRPGFSTTLQSYNPETSASSAASVDVLGREAPSRAGAEGTWVVRSRSAGVERTIRIGERSRTMRSVDVIADSTRFRTTLIQP